MEDNHTVSTATDASEIDYSNRREFERVTYRVDVTVESESTFYNGFTENISTGGLFVATYDVRPLGQKVSLEFTIPGHRHRITIEGEICWLREYNETTPDMIPGMGVRFLNLEEPQMQAIERFIEHREPLFYDDDL